MTDEEHYMLQTANWNFRHWLMLSNWCY